MKNLFKTLSLALYALPLAVFAGQDPITLVPSGSFLATATTLEGTIKTITGGVANVFFAISVLFFLAAGFSYLTSGGDSKKVTDAQNKLIYAIIGLAVALFAYALPSIIATFVTT